LIARNTIPLVACNAMSRFFFYFWSNDLMC
jgi:hypothetical protein